MGGFATIHVGLKHPARASSLVVAGCGYGAPKDARSGFQRETHAVADRLEREGAGPVGADYALGSHPRAVPGQGPARLGHLPRPARRGIPPRARPIRCAACSPAAPRSTTWKRGLAALTLPTLLITGDEDEPCLDANLYLKRTIPAAGPAG